MGATPNQQSESPPLGIDFVFEIGMRNVEKQIEEIDALDLKISVLFGFLGTVLVALFAVVLSAEPNPSAPPSQFASVCLLLGVVFTGIAIFNAFLAFRERPLFRNPRFENLFRSANDNPENIKYQLLDTLRTALEANAREIDRKRVLRIVPVGAFSWHS